MTPTTTPIDNILTVFINCDNRKIHLCNLELQLKMTSTPIDQAEINWIMMGLKSLFEPTCIFLETDVHIEVSVLYLLFYNFSNK